MRVDNDNANAEDDDDDNDDTAQKIYILNNVSPTQAQGD